MNNSKECVISAKFQRALLKVEKKNIKLFEEINCAL